MKEGNISLMVNMSNITNTVHSNRYRLLLSHLWIKSPDSTFLSFLSLLANLQMLDIKLCLSLCKKHGVCLSDVQVYLHVEQGSDKWSRRGHLRHMLKSSVN